MAHTNAHVHTTTHHVRVTHKHACIFTHTTPHTPPCAHRMDTVLSFLQADKGHDKTVEILLQAGATVDLPEQGGKLLFITMGKWCAFKLE